MLTAAAALTTGLAACSSDDDMAAGTPFTQALAKNYADLAGQAAALPGTEIEKSFFDSLNPFSDSQTSSDVLAEAFTAKAKLASAGTEPEPEAANGAVQATVRTRLVRALATTKDQFPEQAARAEADYDCWVLYGAVKTAAEVSRACGSALETSLTGLENPARLASAPAPTATTPAPDAPPTASSPPVATPAPTAAATPAPVRTEFTVYFDFDSWTLKAEQLKVLDDVIANARSGGQSNSP